MPKWISKRGKWSPENKAAQEVYDSEPVKKERDYNERRKKELKEQANAKVEIRDSKRAA